VNRYLVKKKKKKRRERVKSEREGRGGCQTPENWSSVELTGCLGRKKNGGKKLLGHLSPVQEVDSLRISFRKWGGRIQKNYEWGN